MKTPDTKMNEQTRLAADYQRQLNRFRTLLQSTPRVVASSSRSPSVPPISVQAFGGFLMTARTEEQVRAFVAENLDAAEAFCRHADIWAGLSAPYPPETMHAVDEAHLPFHILGWLAGGEPEGLFGVALRPALRS